MTTTVNENDTNEVSERDNLAVVYRVERLEPIQGKDRVELVHLKDCGYTAVCEKLHAVGDLVVFTKFDTIVPDNELFGWMKESKFRVKAKAFTIKNEYDTVIGKIYSQGIVLPLKTCLGFLNDYAILNNITPTFLEYGEGKDLTEVLGVKKYIPPVSGSGMGNMQSKGDFPTHLVSKTDEVNLASKMRVLSELHGKTVYFSLKIEGSSLSVVPEAVITSAPEEGEHDLRVDVNVCSRNNILVENETNKFYQACNKYDLVNKMKSVPYFAVQAECYGEGIQKNKLGIKGVDLAVFNVIDTRSRVPLGLESLKNACSVLGVPTVPILLVVENFDWTFEQLQEYADKLTYANPDVLGGTAAEGMVIRPIEPEWSPVLATWLSVKVINRDYKL